MCKTLGLTILLLFTVAPCYPQSCNPAAVYYIVRDEKGAVMNDAQVRAIGAQLPKKIGDAGVETGQASLASDHETFYWEDSTDWKQGDKLPALIFANAATCTMQLGEATLTFQGKKMRLIFDVGITRDQLDRRPVIDSQPFQEGTFKLDLTGWTHDRNKIIPAKHWRKIGSVLN